MKTQDSEHKVDQEVIRMEGTLPPSLPAPARGPASTLPSYTSVSFLQDETV